MPQPQPAGDPSYLAAVREYARAYIEAGYSIIPTDADKRPNELILPGRHWEEYQQRRATLDDVERWLLADPSTGLGIVLGPISDNLSAYDIDDARFSAWIEERATDLLLRRTWTTRTGSGKLHILLKTDEPALTQKVVGCGRKLAEIRGWSRKGESGAYVVAPPSRVSIHNGGAYTLLFNGPDKVARVRSSTEAFLALMRTYVKTQAEEARALVETPSGEPQRVIEELPPQQAGALRHRLLTDRRVSGRTRRAILDGATPGEGEWPQSKSRSDIDYAVVIALRRAEWEPADIERVYATFPIGFYTYRRRASGGSYGWVYLATTIAGADAENKRQDAAEKQAKGANFEILRVTRLDYEADPHYEIELLFSDGRRGTALLDSDDLMVETAFIKAVLRHCKIMPELLPQHLGLRQFRAFGAIVADMAQVEEVPTDATVVGHLRTTIASTLRQELAPRPPIDPGDVTLGWCDEPRSLAFVRGTALLARVAGVIRPIPRPELVWSVLRGWGGRARQVTLGGGTSETVWTMPLGALKKPPPPK